MTRHDLDFIAASRTAFADTAPMSLADLRAKVAVGAKRIVRRDMLSALDAVTKLFKRDLSHIPSTPKSLRELFASTNAIQLGVSPKRYANIRSGILGALKAFREPHLSITKRSPLTVEWAQLLARVPPIERFKLNRLGAFCSAMKVSPNAVTKIVLLAFFTALEEEEAIKNPKFILASAVSVWNRMGRLSGHWPEQRLGSPFDREVFCFSIDEFPKSFQRELAEWRKNLEHPDPLETDHVDEPLRPVTAAWLERILLRFASALVHAGQLTHSQVTGISVLLVEENFKAGFRFYLQRFNNKPNGYLASMAQSLIAAGKHHCKLPHEKIERLSVLARRLRPRQVDPLTPRNRTRLAQFDTDENVVKLLTYPAAERARGHKLKNLDARAKSIEHALMVSLLIHCKLRMQTLRTLELADFRKGLKGRRYLFVAGAKLKSGRPLEFEVPDYVADLFDEFVRDHRIRMEGQEGAFLFPSRGGKPRYHSSIRSGLMKSLLKYTGLIMNPHLFRHALTKIVVERKPELLFALSKQLGHKNIETTLKYYMGTEQRAAGRQIDEVIMEAMKTSGRRR